MIVESTVYLPEVFPCREGCWTIRHSNLNAVLHTCSRKFVIAELNGLLSAVSLGGTLATDYFAIVALCPKEEREKVLFGGTLLQVKNSKGSSTGAGYWSEKVIVKAMFARPEQWALQLRPLFKVNSFEFELRLGSIVKTDTDSQGANLQTQVLGLCLSWLLAFFGES